MGDRDRNQGGGGGGKLSPSTICTYCGARYLIQEGCKLKDDRPSHGAGATVQFRECMACHGAAPPDGDCPNCRQNRGKGDKKSGCPACHNPLSAEVASCRCGWERGMWQCKDCTLWWHPDNVECPKCLKREARRAKREDKTAEKARRLARTFVTCQTCHRPYGAANKWCDHCNVKCVRCERWYPKDQAKCPFCDKLIRYELRVDSDSDDEAREYEVFVQFLKIMGDKEPQGLDAVVQLRDPAIPDRPGGYPILPTGSTIRTPFREEDRKIRVILMSCPDGSVGTYTQELILDGKPTKFRRRQVRWE